MSIDWAAVLKGQAEIVQRLARDVPAALGSPDLTLNEASQIYSDVEHGAQAFDAIVDKMKDFDVDEALFDVAESIEDILGKLSLAAANKVRALQGLDPVEPYPEDDETT
jgi:hypothetical protein